MGAAAAGHVFMSAASVLEGQADRDTKVSLALSVFLQLPKKGLPVDIETVTGYSYTGTLESCDEHFNCELVGASVVRSPPTAGSSHAGKAAVGMERVFLRGSAVLFVRLPDAAGAAYDAQGKLIRRTWHKTLREQKAAALQERRARRKRIEERIAEKHEKKGQPSTGKRPVEDRDHRGDSPD